MTVHPSSPWDPNAQIPPMPEEEQALYDWLQDRHSDLRDVLELGTRDEIANFFLRATWLVSLQEPMMPVLAVHVQDLGDSGDPSMRQHLTVCGAPSQENQNITSWVPRGQDGNEAASCVECHHRATSILPHLSPTRRAMLR